MKRKVLLLTSLLTLLFPSLVYAQDGAPAAYDLSVTAFLSTVIYGLLGIILCVVGYFAFDRIAGLDIQRELVEDQNTAIGIMLGGAFIGIAIVVAAVVG